MSEMEDLQVIAAILAGDPAGLAAAYDQYAMPLYAYCRSMLPEPADAADAVQDTFLVATVELRGLRDPARLRPWLYAVARNECLRRLRSRSLAATLDEAADLPADSETADPAVIAERADLRALVRSAIDGLNLRDRDIVELSLVHGLEGNDLIDVLGVPRNHAHALLSRARSQLEKSLGALVVARGGRQACRELDVVLDGWDGRLTALMRKRINRHVEQCQTCGECRRRELSQVLLAGLAPWPAVLPGFRDQVLRVLADHSPAGFAHRLVAAKLAGPFGPSGFPRAMSVPVRPAVRPAHALAAGTVMSVLAAGAVVVVGIGGSHPGVPPGVVGSTHGAAVPSRRGPGPGSGGTSPAPSARAAAYSAPAAAYSAPAAAYSAPAAQGPRGAASPAGVPGSSGPPDVVAVVVSGRASPSAATPAPSQGTLTVSPTALDLVALNGTPIGTLTLTAEGGPVSDYSVSVGSALAGEITVSPSSGSLAAGASVTVTVTVTSLLAVNAPITVNPGDQRVVVLLGA
jgi:RNA polymerase sigma factor (sigma-70 family)